MNAAQQGIGHAVTIAGIRRLLRKNPDGSYGPGYADEPEKTRRPPTPALTQGRAVDTMSLEADHEKAYQVAGEILRDVGKIAAQSKHAATVYSYTGATHETMQLGLKLALAVAGEARQGISDVVDWVNQLVAAVAALERRKSFYRGTWDAAETYEEGDFATHAGSLWACLTTTRSRPGTSDDWQLAAKRGRDGRTAR